MMKPCSILMLMNLYLLSWNKCKMIIEGRQKKMYFITVIIHYFIYMYEIQYLHKILTETICMVTDRCCL